MEEGLGQSPRQEHGGKPERKTEERTVPPWTLLGVVMVAILVATTIIIVVYINAHSGTSRPPVATSTSTTGASLTLPEKIQGDHLYLGFSDRFNTTFPGSDDRGFGIVKVEDDFEKSHPKLRVTNWTAYEEGGILYGLHADVTPCGCEDPK